MSPTDHHPTDLTFREAEGLEDREQRGEILTDSELHALSRMRAATKHIAVAFAPLQQKIRRQTIKSVCMSIGKITKPVAEEWRKVEGYVKKQPAWKRQRYEHMTIREIRREMDAAASSTRIVHRCQGRGRVRRPAVKRTAASSSTSSADPGDGDPEPRPAVLQAAADSLIGSDWPADQIDLAFTTWTALTTLTGRGRS